MFYSVMVESIGEMVLTVVVEGVVLGVVTIISEDNHLIVFPGLYLASIALLSKGKVEIMTLNTDPILSIMFLRRRLRMIWFIIE